MSEISHGDIGKGRRLRIIVRGALVLMTLYYIVLAIIAPAKKLRTFGEGVYPDEMIVTEDSVVSALQREKLFLKSRIELAGFDSTGLSIDLISRTIGLELKGVMLHSANIERTRYGQFLNSVNEVNYSRFFSGTFTPVKQHANFKKVPIRIVDAPRDTSGLLPDIITADTSSLKPSNVYLELDNGIVVRLIDNDARFFKRFAWDISGRVVMIASNLYHVIRFNIPDYNPVIKLYLPGREIRTIYRAIPVSGRIAIRI